MGWSYKKWIVVCILAAGVGGGYFWRKRNSEIENRSRAAVTPERTELKEVLTSVGTIVPSRTTTVNAPYNGYIHKIYPRVGTRVKGGAPLVTVTSTLDGISQAFPIRAPFDGTVVQIFRSEGEYVEAGTGASEIIRLDNVERLFVLADFTERDIPNIHFDQIADLRPAAFPDRVLRGKVIEVPGASYEDKLSAGQAKKNFTAFRSKIEVMEPTKDLLPGMSVFVEITVKSHSDALALPLYLVEKRRKKWVVHLEDGTEKTVEVGLFHRGRIEIVSGLSESDRVVPPKLETD